MTLRQVGGALGIALFGSLVAGTCDERLDTAGLPPRAADAARDSLSGAAAARPADRGGPRPGHGPAGGG
ncbi:hypothetical protein ABZ192_32060 [Streptomyces sp. NPDC006235]|uniref:hypothetical protein n=1 Tax=Streptomyces sp. NPDC006235 TaxID=3156736 RepID=UPI0033B1CD98